MHSQLDEDGSSIFQTYDCACLAWRFCLFGNVLFAVYCVLLIGAVLPLRLLDPAWQIECINQLVWNAHLPLIGLGLVHLAVYFDPLSSRLVRHRDRVARLALPVALGFLLVVPLLGLASVRAHGALDPQSLRHARAIHDLEAISEAVEGSGSVEDLQRRLARLRAPALLAADAALPLQRLKIKLGEDLRVARQAINRDLAPPARPSLAHSLRGHLRTALMALVLAVAFVCGSQGRRSLRSPLQEWLVVWSQRRRLAQEQRRIRRVFRQRIRGLQAEQQLLLRAVRFHFRAPGVALPDQPPVDREFVPPDPMQPAPPREQPESA